MITWANPWGFLGLSAIPVIFWLYRHVLHQQTRPVSALFLWETTTLLPAEGPVKQRWQFPWVLWLECLAALFLSLALAQPQWTTTQIKPRLGILLDGTVSMSSQDNAPWKAALSQLKTLQQQQPNMHLTVIISAPIPTILELETLESETKIPAANPKTQTGQTLQQWQPNQPGHDRQPAIQALSSLFPQPEQTLIFSDDAHLQHPRLVRVGSATANTGFIAARWNPGESPFVVIQHFGPSPYPNLAIHIETETEIKPQSWDLPVQFNAQGIAALTLILPPTRSPTASLRLTLPKDDLLQDNTLTLAPPALKPLKLQLAINPDWVPYFAKLPAAIPGLEIISNSDQADWIIQQTLSPNKPNNPNNPPIFLSRWLPIQQKTTRQTDLLIHPDHPLMNGIETHGLVIYSQPVVSLPDFAEPLLYSLTTPLIWLENAPATPPQLVINIDGLKSNWFQHSSFPVFFYNWVEYLRTEQGGLTRWNYTTGESITLRRPRYLPPDAQLSLINPQGQTLSIPHHPTDPFMRLGYLSPGLYQWHAVATSPTHPIEIKETFAVNALDANESDLSHRLPPTTTLPELPNWARQPPAQQYTHTATTLLTLFALGCLLLAWYILYSQKNPHKTRIKPAHELS